MKTFRYPIVIEKAKYNYAAYCPDFPGCVATAKTIESVQEQLTEALISHLENLKESNQPIPATKSQLGYIDIQVEI
ncbi:MAG: type II toxin-antitoxin system HicB family antitoxin [Pleurocapsa sp. MO_226.B13]|nr:type II toxin-antitoxin system HicB family antitoxin [Pleurocapsa sp. MO_226.B13]